MLCIALAFIPTIACLGWVGYEKARTRRQSRTKRNYSFGGPYKAQLALAGSFVVMFLALVSLTV